MTMKEFSDATGVAKETIRYYCNEGLLAPNRTGRGVSNNRRQFDDDDLARMQQILIYRKLGMSIGDIKKMMSSPSYDIPEALEDAIDALNKRVRHLQNVVLLARMSQIFGTTMFAFGAYSDDRIDALAQQMRSNPSYGVSVKWLDALTPEGASALAERFHNIYLEFSHLKDIDSDVKNETDGFVAHVVGLVDEYCKIFDVANVGVRPVDMFALAFSMMGDGVLNSEADRVGGEGTAEFMGACVLWVWACRATAEIAPVVREAADLVSQGKDSSSQVGNLAALVDKYAGCDAVLMAEKQGMHPAGNHESYVEGLLGLIESFASDTGVQEVLGLDEDALPSKEAYSIAVRELKKYWKSKETAK